MSNKYKHTPRDHIPTGNERPRKNHGQFGGYAQALMNGVTLTDRNIEGIMQEFYNIAHGTGETPIKRLSSNKPEKKEKFVSAIERLNIPHAWTPEEDKTLLQTGRGPENVRDDKVKSRLYKLSGMYWTKEENALLKAGRYPKNRTIANCKARLMMLRKAKKRGRKYKV